MKIFQVLFLFVLILAGCRTDSDVTAPDDGLPPAVPSGLTITFANDGEIVMEWNPNREPDWNSYHIYRSINNEDYVRIKTLSTEFFLDDSLEYDTRYYYKISAEDNAGKESSLSGEVSAIPANIYPPDKPVNLKINGRNLQNNFSVQLNWYPGYESDIIGYNIYRSDQELFQTDSLTLWDFTTVNSYTDILNLELYKKYFYKIRGVDRGQLIGKESDLVSDLILDIPAVIYPPDGAFIDPFLDFSVKALEVPATYKIIVQTNEFFGEFWSAEVSSQIINDTLSIPFNPLFLESNKKYFWRIAAYSGGPEPNSISVLFNFTIRP